MNNLQISTILSNNRITKPSFKGVFSSNNIPIFSHYPHCFVANTDRMGYKGTHWIACYCPSRLSIEYFDPLGERPNTDLQKYLSRFPFKLYNTYQIQSPFSSTCGHYCIYFLLMRCNRISFKESINILKTKPINLFF